MIHSVTRALEELYDYTNDPIVIAMVTSWLYANRIYEWIFRRYGLEIRKRIVLNVEDIRMSTGSIRRTYIVTSGLFKKKEFRISEVIYPRRKEEWKNRSTTTRCAA